MKLRAFHIHSDRPVEPTQDWQATVADSDHGLPSWIDIDAPDPEGLAEVAATLDLHPVIVQRIVDPNAPAGTWAFGSCLFVQIPMIETWDSAERPMLSIVCSPDFLLTGHHGRSNILDQLEQAESHHLGTRGADTTLLLYRIIDQVVDRSVEEGLAARNSVDALERSITTRDEPEDIGKAVLRMKRHVARFGTRLEEQHRCVSALIPRGGPILDLGDLHEYLRDALSQLDHEQRYLDGTERRVAQIYEHYRLLIQLRTNRRLNILTMVSAVFMPLSLITGIYGMNFSDMPELHWPDAYPIVLGAMAVIAVSLVSFFVRKGWFD